jgi:hypothetical protein
MQNHPIPKDAIVIEMAEHLGADDREAFEERAAIIEYDGHLPRAHAECLALLEVLRRDAHWQGKVSSSCRLKSMAAPNGC